MKIPLFLLNAVMLAVLFGMGPISDSPKASAPASQAAETAKAFLAALSQDHVGDAMKLWDGKTLNEKLKARIEKQAAKVKQFGGIARVDVGTCEDRRVQKHEKETGEKIDVVPVEIICGDGNLLLAVFSIREVDGQPRIFLLESLKEWGGTASLDEEKPYAG